jgi:hypothetical protein
MFETVSLNGERLIKLLQTLCESRVLISELQCDQFDAYRVAMSFSIRPGISQIPVRIPDMCRDLKQSLTSWFLKGACGNRSSPATFISACTL